jgi:Protein of unknown function (DUF4232)
MVRSVILLVASAVVFAASSAALASDAPRCPTSELGVRAGATNAAAGSELAEYAFVNRGHGSCTLYGYPHLTLLEGAAAPLATTDRDASAGFDGVRERLVTLAHGQEAWFGVYFADRTGYGNLTCPTAARLRFTPPGSSRSITLSVTGAHISPYGGSIEHLRCGSVQLTPVSAHPLGS